jgi:NHS family xanthosine MFS transporter
VVDYFTVDGVKNWQNIWFTFAAYALVLGLVFPFAFRYKHTAETAHAQPALH